MIKYKLVRTKTKQINFHINTYALTKKITHLQKSFITFYNL